MISVPWTFTSWTLFLIFTSLVCPAYSATPNAQDVTYEAGSENVTRDKLTSFAGAYKAITQIGDTYAQRIIQSESIQKFEALQEEANHQMTQAVADHGLSIEDYNTIFRTIQNNPALREEFLIVLHDAK